MKRNVTVAALVLLACALAFGLPQYEQRQTTMRGGTTSGAAGRRDSIDIPIGLTGDGSKVTTASVYVDKPQDSVTFALFSKRGFGLKDSVIVRLMTGDAYGTRTVVVTDSFITDFVPPILVPITVPATNGLVSDTIFKTYTWLTVIIADTCSDTTITTGRVIWPIQYEYRVKK